MFQPWAVHRLTNVSGEQKGGKFKHAGNFLHHPVVGASMRVGHFLFSWNFPANSSSQLCTILAGLLAGLSDNCGPLGSKCGPCVRL